jgi:hypothetical protein
MFAVDLWAKKSSKTMRNVKKVSVWKNPGFNDNTRTQKRIYYLRIYILVRIYF